MDAISTTMPHVEHEPEDIESKEGIIDRNIPLVKLTMPSKYFKCGEIFVEDTLKLTLVCALCEKQFTEMKLFGAHITCVHLSSEKFEPLLLETVKEEFSIEEDPFQDENSNYDSSSASNYGVPDGMNGKHAHIKVSAADDSDITRQRKIEKLSSYNPQLNPKKYLKHGKWTDYCGKCGFKFQNNRDYKIHYKLRHTNLSNEEKAQLEKAEASIVYVAHTCPICDRGFTKKRGFKKHLKRKHTLDPKIMKLVLEKEYQNTRDKTDQGRANAKILLEYVSDILNQGESREKDYTSSKVLGTKSKLEQTQENVKKQQSEVSAGDDNDNTSQRNTEKFVSNYRSHENPNKYLEHGKWTDFCSRCGLKFQNNQDYKIHHKLRHTDLSNEEKTQLEKVEASIVYVAHTCPICYRDHKTKSGFVRHLKKKHSPDPEIMKLVLKKEYRTTRDKTDQVHADTKILLEYVSDILNQGESQEKDYNSSTVLGTEKKLEQTQKNVKKQQSEAIDPESFVINENTPAIKSNGISTEQLTAITNMTADSMPGDMEIVEEEFETEMDVANEECSNAPDLCTQADDYDIAIEKHVIPIEKNFIS